MKLVKAILAATFALGVVAPVVTTAGTAQAATIKQAYTQAERNYLNYNGRYFTVMEKKAYDAKYEYYHVLKGAAYDGIGSKWERLSQLRQDWGNLTSTAGRAYRPQDVPPTFRWTNVYFQRAVAAMDGEATAFEKVATNWNADPRIKAEQTKILAAYEKEYTKNKNLYCSYVTQLNKTHK